MLITSIKTALFKSNHYKHLIGGILVYLIGRIISCPEGALYATIVAALSLELKDELCENKFDWIDVLYTITIPIILYIVEIIVSLR